MDVSIFIGLSLLVLLSAIGTINSLLKNRFISISLIISFVILFIVFIPTLNLYFSDMVRYLKAFNYMSNSSLSSVFEAYSWEPLFILYQWTLSKISSNPLFFILITYLLFTLILYKAIRNIFVPWQYIYVYFAFLCYPFFYSYIFNGIRQGLAMVMILLAITYWIKKRNSYKFYILIIFSGLTHATSFFFTIPLVLALISKIRIKYLLAIWIVSTLLFITDLNTYITNLGFISASDYIDVYTSDTVINAFGETNKLNFLVFSTFFLILSLILYKKLNLEENIKKVYLVLIKSYLIFNTIFLLFGFIGYSNRLAMYSWYIIPFLVLYPILYERKYSSVFLVIVILIWMIIGWVTSPFIVYA